MAAALFLRILTTARGQIGRRLVSERILGGHDQVWLPPTTTGLGLIENLRLVLLRQLFLQSLDLFLELRNLGLLPGDRLGLLGLFGLDFGELGL